jgi:hypothetical protein
MSEPTPQKKPGEIHLNFNAETRRKVDEDLSGSEMSHCWRCLKPAPNDDESDAGWSVMALDDCFVRTCPDCFDPDGYDELDS